MLVLVQYLKLPLGCQLSAGRWLLSRRFLLYFDSTSLQLQKKMESVESAASLRHHERPALLRAPPAGGDGSLQSRLSFPCCSLYCK